MSTTLDLLRGAGGPARGGDGAAVFTSLAAPDQLSVGQLLLVIVAMAVVSAVVGALAAVVASRKDHHGT